jgi:cytochrome b561
MSTAVTAAGRMPPRSYTLSQIMLHWSIAALVIWQLVFGESMEALEHRAGADAGELFLANTHIWFGFAILALVALRIALRLWHGAPAPEEPNRAAALLARAAHAAFYVLLVAMPVTGILDFYFHLPTGEIHELGKPLFIALIALHVAATAWHALIRRDGTLRRMLVPAR